MLGKVIILTQLWLIARVIIQVIVDARDYQSKQGYSTSIYNEKKGSKLWEFWPHEVSVMSVSVISSVSHVKYKKIIWVLVCPFYIYAKCGYVQFFGSEWVWLSGLYWLFNSVIDISWKFVGIVLSLVI